MGVIRNVDGGVTTTFEIRTGKGKRTTEWLRGWNTTSWRSNSDFGIGFLIVSVTRWSGLDRCCGETCESSIDTNCVDDCSNFGSHISLDTVDIILDPNNFCATPVDTSVEASIQGNLDSSWLCIRSDYTSCMECNLTTRICNKVEDIGTGIWVFN